MKVVIQCAASKHESAGRMKGRNGKDVVFVARPSEAPDSEDCNYARPDDPAYDGNTWRELLMRYNSEAVANPLNLFPAWKLYDNDTYGLLVAKYGIDSVFILSAGWGLINSEFLTPYYDITFSPSAANYKRRRKSDRYEDLCLIDSLCVEPLVFFGGKDYQPLFAKLTRNYGGVRHVFFNSTDVPDMPGCRLLRYETTTRTNWHYQCAKAFMAGRVTL